MTRLRRSFRGTFGIYARRAAALGASLGAVWPLALSLAVPQSGLSAPLPIVASSALGLAAGLGFGALAQRTIGQRAERVAAQMRAVSDQVKRAADAGQVGRCTPGRCRIDGILDDALGDCASAYTDLVAALTRSTEVESAARDFSETLCEGLELGGLARKGLARLMDATGASAGAVLVARDGELAVAADAGFDRSGELTAWRPLLKEIAASQKRDDGDRAVGKSVSVEADVVFRSLLDEPGKIATARVVPLSIRGATVGVVVLATPRPISGEAEAIVRLFSPVLAVAMKSALAQEDLAKASSFDLMTGLVTRETGLKKLREALLASLRAGTSVGVLLVDIDQLDAVNESHGRVYGDRAIVHVAHTIRRMLRPADALVRWGGDELLIVLDGATREDTRAFAERILIAVKALVVLDVHEPIKVSVSVGGDAYPNDPVEYEDDLVEHARRALEHAKLAGPGSIAMFRFNEMMTSRLYDEFADDDEVEHTISGFDAGADDGLPRAQPANDARSHAATRAARDKVAPPRNARHRFA